MLIKEVRKFVRATKEERTRFELTSEPTTIAKRLLSILSISSVRIQVLRRIILGTQPPLTIMGMLLVAGLSLVRDIQWF